MVTGAVVVRVIEYELEGVSGAEPFYRLITTIVDPGQAPATELAALHPINIDQCIKVLK